MRRAEHSLSHEPRPYAKEKSTLLGLCPRPRDLSRWCQSRRGSGATRRRPGLRSWPLGRRSGRFPPLPYPPPRPKTIVTECFVTTPFTNQNILPVALSYFVEIESGIQVAPRSAAWRTDAVRSNGGHHIMSHGAPRKVDDAGWTHGNSAFFSLSLLTEALSWTLRSLGRE